MPEESILKVEIGCKMIEGPSKEWRILETAKGFIVQRLFTEIDYKWFLWFRVGEIQSYKWRNITENGGKPYMRLGMCTIYSMPPFDSKEEAENKIKELTYKPIIHPVFI